MCSLRLPTYLPSLPSEWPKKNQADVSGVGKCHRCRLQTLADLSDKKSVGMVLVVLKRPHKYQNEISTNYCFSFRMLLWKLFRMYPKFRGCFVLSWEKKTTETSWVPTTFLLPKPIISKKITKSSWRQARYVFKSSSCFSFSSSFCCFLCSCHVQDAKFLSGCLTASSFSIKQGLQAEKHYSIWAITAIGSTRRVA